MLCVVKKKTVPATWPPAIELPVSFSPPVSLPIECVLPRYMSPSVPTAVAPLSTATTVFALVSTLKLVASRFEEPVPVTLSKVIVALPSGDTHAQGSVFAHSACCVVAEPTGMLLKEGCLISPESDRPIVQRRMLSAELL